VTAAGYVAQRPAAVEDGLPKVASVTAASPAEIEALARAGEPVLLKGLIDGWPALAAGRESSAALTAYLKRLDQGAPVPVMEAPAASGGRFGYAQDLREFSFSKRQRPLRETLDRILRNGDLPGAPVVAIQMLPLAERLSGFVRDNPMPFLPADAEPRLWLGGPVHTQIHNDPDHNLACVVAGRRRFLLFPPEQVGNLYIGPPDRAPPLSLVDPEAPDLERFPRFAEADIGGTMSSRATRSTRWSITGGGAHRAGSTTRVTASLSRCLPSAGCRRRSGATGAPCSKCMSSTKAARARRTSRQPCAPTSARCLPTSAQR
jgi:hypothetical protein